MKRGTFDSAAAARRSAARRERARDLIAAARAAAQVRLAAHLASMPAKERAGRKPMPLTSRIGSQIGLRKVRQRLGSMPFVSIQHGDDDDVR